MNALLFIVIVSWPFLISFYLLAEQWVLVHQFIISALNLLLPFVQQWIKLILVYNGISGLAGLALRIFCFANNPTYFKQILLALEPKPGSHQL